jgi:hypothetical protein
MKLLPALLFALALTGGCPGEAPSIVEEPTLAVEAEPAPSPVQGRTTAAAPAEGDVADQPTCCAQCAQGARTDPAAMDLSLLPCFSYRDHQAGGQPVMTAACATWFAGHPLMVQDCR